jgi:CHAD domain-containing protein
MAQPRLPRPVHARPLKLRKSQRLGEAVATTLQSSGHQVLANIEGARLAYDAESLHQLRIGLRRLRAALSVYRELIPATLWRSWAHRLRSLERGVSSARDWDVLAGEIGNASADGAGQADFGSLLREARVRQEKSHRDSRQVLGGAALTRIISEIERYAAVQSHASGTDEKSYEEQLLPFARRLLSLRDRKVRRAGRGLRKLKTAELHKLRIRIKKLRYAAEFFAGLWSKTASEPYLASLRGLQDELGLLQDATTGASLLTVIERRRLKPSLVHMRARLRKSNRRARHRILHRWREFKSAEGFWKSDAL